MEKNIHQSDPKIQKEASANLCKWEKADFLHPCQYSKFLGIKVNIEMLYLVDEMFKQKDKPLKLFMENLFRMKHLINDIMIKPGQKKVKKHVYQLGKK